MSTRVLRRATLLFLVFGVCVSIAAWAQQPQCTTSAIQTSSGPVCGTAWSSKIPETGTFNVNAYLGIPYANPPVGPLRWQNPVPFPKSAATLQATTFRNRCPQSVVAASGGNVPPMNQCTDGKILGPNQSEDCLYLNVWVPTGATASSQLPVMVFIHGGAFVEGTGGSAVSDLYDGTYLAATGNVIVVTFNYRLGVLGFLAQGSGYNFGFADQLLALQWVQKNIASFGGNPKNVMLFGESAGAMSVGLHALSSPQSAGLFQAALMESNPFGLPYKSTDEANTLSTSFCGTSASSLCTTKATACDLIEAQNTFQGIPILPDALAWAPVVDNTLIISQPLASAAKLSVPLILGTNHDEGIAFAGLIAQKKPLLVNSVGYMKVLNTLFDPSISAQIRALPRYHCGTSFDCTTQIANVVTDSMFTCANRNLALQASQGTNPQPLYIYQFTQATNFNLWSSPNPNVVTACAGKVCHADELPYVFNTAQNFGSNSFLPAEEALSQKMGSYWTSFAANHAPGSTWPLFAPNKTYLLLNESSTISSDPLAELANCSFWNNLGDQTMMTWSRLVAELNSKKN